MSQDSYSRNFARQLTQMCQATEDPARSEGVKHQTESFLANSLVASTSIRFSIDLNVSSIPIANGFHDATGPTIEILRHSTNSRAHSRENAATLTVSSPIAHRLPRFPDFHSIACQQVHTHTHTHTRARANDRFEF